MTTISNATALSPLPATSAPTPAANARAADGDYKTRGPGHTIKDADGDYKPTAGRAGGAVAGATLGAVTALNRGG